MKPERNIYKLKPELLAKYMKRKELKLTEYVGGGKRIWINNKVRQIEEASNKNDARKFLKEVQFFNKQKSVLPISCKHESGNILSEHRDILRRWRQYFGDLQTISSGTEELISENVILSNFDEVPPPTYYEVNQVIEKLNLLAPELFFKF